MLGHHLYCQSELGSAAPTSKPRMDGISSAAAVAEPELSAKELKAKEKAERKAQLAEKKAARKAKKGGTDDGTEEKGDDDGMSPPNFRPFPQFGLN